MKDQTRLRIRVPRWLGWLVISVCFVALLFWPDPLLAQIPDPNANSSGVIPMRTVMGDSTTLPAHWFLIMAAMALLVPAGFILVGVAGLDPSRAWDAALGGMAAIGLASFGYWAVGFAFQFGGVGLVYPQAGLRDLVWEWSPFAADWGAGWGVAGLSGWFLAGSTITPLAYALFLAHVPWAITAAALPIVALRGRAPATATLILAFVLGGVIYPLAGNWVRGGGWLGALGNNLNLGHGFVDFGGAGTVHLVAAGVALSALVVWVPRRVRQQLQEPELLRAQQPLLAVVGSLLLLSGSFGWMWANPLQLGSLDELALLRGSVNAILFASGGILVPLAYTWFVTGKSEPLMSARGLAAGVVAGMAAGPFIQPGPAFAIGLIAGATIPFVTYLVDGLLRLDDATGAISISGLPAMVGLLALGIFADGAAGQGWHMTGVENYLGVSGQGVSGLLTGSGFQADFPGQLQAQVIGILSLALWGFSSGMLICAPLGLLLHSLLRSTRTPIAAPGVAGDPSGFTAEPLRQAPYPPPNYPPPPPAERGNRPRLRQPDDRPRSP
jgi:Amt family ammonium transporter